MMKKSKILLASVLLFTASASAIDLNDTESLDYWSDNTLDFRVDPDGTIQAQNSLNLNGNAISNADWSNANDLNSGGGISDFSNANDLDGSGNLGSGTVSDNEIADNTVDNSEIQNGASFTFGGVTLNGALDTNGNQLDLDNGEQYITIHDGNGNFNIKSGVDPNNNIVAGSGGTHVKLDESGGFDVSVDESTGTGNAHSEDVGLGVNGGEVDVRGGNLNINGNSITNIGGLQNCGANEFVNGNGNCETDTDTDTDNQNLGEVLDQGNTANQAIDMGGYNINNVGYVDTNRIDVFDQRDDGFNSGDDPKPNYWQGKTMGTLFSNGLPRTSNWHSGMVVQGWNSDNYETWQIYGPSTSSLKSDPEWYLRNGMNDTWNTPRKIITDDGSGNVNIDSGNFQVSGQLTVGSTECTGTDQYIAGDGSCQSVGSTTDDQTLEEVLSQNNLADSNSIRVNSSIVFPNSKNSAVIKTDYANNNLVLEGRDPDQDFVLTDGGDYVFHEYTSSRNNVFEIRSTGGGDGEIAVGASGSNVPLNLNGNAITNADWSNANDLNSGGGISDFSNAADLNSGGTISDFSAANDLDGSGNLVSGSVADNEISDNTVDNSEIQNGANFGFGNVDVSSPSNTGRSLDVGGGANFNGNINLNNGGGLDNVNDIEMDGNIYGAGVDMSLQEVGSVLGPNNGDTDLNIQTQGAGSHVVSVEDGSSSNADIAVFEEGTQNVEIPNGNLNVSGQLTVGSTECSSGQVILGDGSCGTAGSAHNKDLVAGSGLSGGANDVLVGSDSDVTVSLNANDLDADGDISDFGDAGDLKSSGDIADGNVENAELANSGITINGGTDISGGSVSLGGSVTVSHADTSSQGNVDTSGGTVIDNVNVDGNGHVTGMGTRNLDSRYVEESESSWGVVSLETGDYKLYNGSSGSLSIPSVGNTNCSGGVCIRHDSSNRWTIQFKLENILYDEDNFPGAAGCSGVSAGDNEIDSENWGSGIRSVVTDTNGHGLGSVSGDLAAAYVYDSSTTSHDVYGVKCEKMS